MKGLDLHKMKIDAYAKSQRAIQDFYSTYPSDGDKVNYKYSSLHSNVINEGTGIVVSHVLNRAYDSRAFYRVYDIKNDKIVEISINDDRYPNDTLVLCEPHKKNMMFIGYNNLHNVLLIDTAHKHKQDTVDAINMIYGNNNHIEVKHVTLKF